MDRRLFLRRVGAVSGGTIATTSWRPASGATGDRPLQDTELGSQTRAATAQASPEGWAIDWRKRTHYRVGQPDRDRVEHGVPLRAAGDALVVAGEAVVAYDAATGTQRWEHQYLKAYAAAASSDLVVVRDVSGTLHGLATSDGTERWTRDGDPANGDPAVTSSLVLAPTGTSLLALDPADGSVAWEAAMENHVTGVVVAGEAAFVTGDEGTVARVSVSDGETAWRESVTWSTPRDPVYDTDRGIVFAVAPGDGFVAVSEDGTDVSHQFPESVHADFDVLDVGSGVMAGVEPGREEHDRENLPTLRVFSLADGDTWRHAFGLPTNNIESMTDDVGEIYLAPQVVDGTVWGAGLRSVAALDAGTGGVQRRWTLPDRVLARPIVTADRVYLLGQSHMFALTRTGGDCGDSVVCDLTVRQGSGHPHGDRVTLEASVSNDGCLGFVTVELWADGVRYGTTGNFAPSGDPHDVSIWRGLSEIGPIHVAGQAKVVIRDTSGAIAEERTVPIDRSSDGDTADYNPNDTDDQMDDDTDNRDVDTDDDMNVETDDDRDEDTEADRDDGDSRTLLGVGVGTALLAALGGVYWRWGRDRVDE